MPPTSAAMKDGRCKTVPTFPRSYSRVGRALRASRTLTTRPEVSPHLDTLRSLDYARDDGIHYAPGHPERSRGISLATDAAKLLLQP